MMLLALAVFTVAAAAPVAAAQLRASERLVAACRWLAAGALAVSGVTLAGLICSEHPGSSDVQAAVAAALVALITGALIREHLRAGPGASAA